MKYLILLALLTGCASQPKPVQWHWDSRPITVKPQETPYVEVLITPQGYLIYRLPVIIPKTEI